MNCQDFERLWNEKLDAFEHSSAEAPTALESHAAECADCRALSARYQVLWQTIQRLGPLPAPSTGFADRVLSKSRSREEKGTALLSLRRLIPVSIAASLVGAFTLGDILWSGRFKPLKPLPQPVTIVSPSDPSDLTEAFAVAGSATWEFAREASGPAARVGRQVLGSSQLRGAAPSLSFPLPVASSAELWQTVEQRINAGARPIGGTARHAFGFLLGATSIDPPPPPASGKGA